MHFYSALQSAKKTSSNDVNAKSAAENDDGKVERWLLYGSSNFDEEFLFKFVQFLAILFHHNELRFLGKNLNQWNLKGIFLQFTFFLTNVFCNDKYFLVTK